MVDTLNALKHSLVNVKNTNEYKNIKKKIKEMNNNSIYMSEYFECFDNEYVNNSKLHQKYYFDIASKIARNSNMFQKHGAVIVYKKNIISTGFNSYNFNSKNNFSIHAEIVAINNAIKNKYKKVLNECKLYIVRIAPECYDCTNSNLLKYSKPCLNCQKYINKFNIDKVYYSTNYEFDKLSNSDDSD